MKPLESFTFEGRLKLEGNPDTDVVAILQQERYDPYSDMSAHIIGGEWHHFWQNRDLPRTLEIHDALPPPERLILSDCSHQKLNLEQAKLQFKDWTKLSTPSSLPPGAMVTIDVELSSHGLIRDRRGLVCDGEGEIERTGEKDPQLFWISADREWQIGIRYHLEDLTEINDIRENRALIAINTIRTRGPIFEPATLDSIIEEAIKKIADPLQIFSFLSRERVAWYRVDACCFREKAGVLGDATRRTTTRKITKPGLRPIFEQNIVAKGLFQKAIINLSTHKSREKIVRAIDFVVGSWCSDGMASALVLFHAALETIIGIIDEQQSHQQSLTPRQQKKLEEHVRKSIKEISETENWSPIATSYALGKVAELKRPPIADLIISHVSASKIYIADLWTDHDDFKIEISRALRVRNNLVHAADTDEAPESRDRLMRLGFLTERLILYVLEI